MAEDNGNPGKQPKRIKRVREDLVKIEAMGSLLDLVLGRAERGEITILPCRPIELDYFDRCDPKNNVVITCAASAESTKWSVRGWHINIATVDGFAFTHNLTRKKSAVVYRFTVGGVERTIIIAHTKDYRAIVAEATKPAAKKS